MLLNVFVEKNLWSRMCLTYSLDGVSVCCKGIQTEPALSFIYIIIILAGTVTTKSRLVDFISVILVTIKSLR